MNSCVGYKPLFIHFFIPPIYIFDKMCNKFDKSLLVVVNTIRTLLFITITFYAYKLCSNNKILSMMILIPLILYIFINIALLIYSIKVQQKFDTV